MTQIAVTDRSQGVIDFVIFIEMITQFESDTVPVGIQGMITFPTFLTQPTKTGCVVVQDTYDRSHSCFLKPLPFIKPVYVAIINRFLFHRLTLSLRYLS